MIIDGGDGAEGRLFGKRSRVGWRDRARALGKSGYLKGGRRGWQVLDRLRRHLSLEKSTTPPGQTPGSTGLRGPSVGGNPKDSVDLSGNDDSRAL